MGFKSTSEILSKSYPDIRKTFSHTPPVLGAHLLYMFMHGHNQGSRNRASNHIVS